MSQLSAVHYIVCKDPGVSVCPETTNTLRCFVVILSVSRQRLEILQCTVIYPWAEYLVYGLSVHNHKFLMSNHKGGK